MAAAKKPAGTKKPAASKRPRTDQSTLASITGQSNNPFIEPVLQKRAEAYRQRGGVNSRSYSISARNLYQTGASNKARPASQKKVSGAPKRGVR